MTKNDNTRQATTHTPEPWIISDMGFPHQPTVRPVATDMAYIAKVNAGRSEYQENARRIGAAVNACQGISTEALEQGIIAELLANLKNLLEQIDEDVPTDITTRHFASAYDEALATLAKATGRAA